MSQRYSDVTDEAVIEQPNLTPEISSRRGAWIAFICVALVCGRRSF